MNSSEINDLIKENVGKRLFVRLNADFMHALAEQYDTIIVAGNSLNAATPHDIDVYSNESEGFNIGELKSFFERMPEDLKISIKSETKNALTITVRGQTYQFCTYCKGGLEELVKSFDYAHVQIGAVVSLDVEDPLFVDTVYCTDEYITALITGNSEYTKSEYPLSSLFRSFKYRKYEQLNGRAWKEAVVKALTDVITRGYEDYEDFKDQLDAIDLGLVKDVDGGIAHDLYTACKDRGLVKNPK